MKSGVEAFRLEGASMFPVFKPGGVVFVLSCSPHTSAFSLSAGDCAVYEFEGRTLLHRVVKAGAAGACFSDDAGRIKPHYVPWSAVRGKVVSRNPFAGGLAGFVYSRGRSLVFPLLNFLGLLPVQ
ncbi:MAG: hypothetical protein A2270_06310 [Elusimicrobia bacterium RIFOXYA12_FULL_51_18]|nr:MAG: hypothetical protein A2270_06310 [Elusimicrobia bacterium RIFOXYA12_FULL_51_18]OGS29814.1 MAG: hypothetical protein A2218_03380 [Elusimicrobia bacterium RIFOXYA2_FULL_53_38]